MKIVPKIAQRMVCVQDDLFSYEVQTQSMRKHLKLMPNTWNCTKRLPLGIQLYSWSCSCMHTVGFQRVKLIGNSFIQMETSASVPKQIKPSDFSMKMNSSWIFCMDYINCRDEVWFLFLFSFKMLFVAWDDHLLVKGVLHANYLDMWPDFRSVSSFSWSFMNQIFE